MELTISFRYTYEYQQQYKYRGVQYRTIREQCLGTQDVVVREITSEVAPIAILCRSDSNEVLNTYRWFDNTLWCSADTFRNKPWTDDVLRYYDTKSYRSEEENRADICEQYIGIILIDGQYYCKTNEPRYVINTFGLGCNHGGTSFSVDHHYNGNIPHYRYFRADHLDIVLAERDRIAESRGDTQSIGTTWHDTLEVLMPEVLRANPSKDYGGKGNEFINKIEGIISVVKQPLLAGMLTVCATESSTCMSFPHCL